MFSVKKINNSSVVKFELNHTVPSHKIVIEDLFKELMSADTSRIIFDMSNIKIIDISSFKSMLNGIIAAKSSGKDIAVVYPDNNDNNYISRIFEISKKDKVIDMKIEKNCY